MPSGELGSRYLCGTVQADKGRTLLSSHRGRWATPGYSRPLVQLQGLHAPGTQSGVGGHDTTTDG